MNKLLAVAALAATGLVVAGCSSSSHSSPSSSTTSTSAPSTTASTGARSSTKTTSCGSGHQHPGYGSDPIAAGRSRGGPEQHPCGRVQRARSRPHLLRLRQVDPHLLGRGQVGPRSFQQPCESNPGSGSFPRRRLLLRVHPATRRELDGPCRRKRRSLYPVSGDRARLDPRRMGVAVGQLPTGRSVEDTSAGEVFVRRWVSKNRHPPGGRPRDLSRGNAGSPPSTRGNSARSRRDGSDARWTSPAPAREGTRTRPAPVPSSPRRCSRSRRDSHRARRRDVASSTSPMGRFDLDVEGAIGLLFDHNLGHRHTLTRLRSIQGVRTSGPEWRRPHSGFGPSRSPICHRSPGRHCSTMAERAELIGSLTTAWAMWS